MLAIMAVQIPIAASHFKDATAKQTTKQTTKHENNAQSSGLFSQEEKQIIDNFFDALRSKETSKSKGKYKSSGKSKKGLPPGLAKKQSLPPGLAKQLEKNGSLPPGLAKRSLPTDLTSRLPTILSDLERIIVGDDVLLIKRGTEIILDILRGAARK